MFKINEDMSIYVTRGDAVRFVFTIKDETSGTDYVFKAGEVVRFKVVEKKACENVMFHKDFPITEDTLKVEIVLSEDETRIGDVISKPTDYWYEIELNPFDNPRTIIGYDDDGAKIFKLFPEGKEIEKDPITPEDIPIVDSELDMTSTRPVENQAISRAIVELRAIAHKTGETMDNFKKEVNNKVDTATSIAKGRNQAHVFTTTEAMQTWLSDANNKGLCLVGDNLYIVEVDVPDWWIAEVLEEADAETGYYYKVARLETQKVDLTNVVADIEKISDVQLDSLSLKKTTKAEYDALTVRDANTLYIVTE